METSNSFDTGRLLGFSEGWKAGFKAGQEEAEETSGEEVHQERLDAYDRGFSAGVLSAESFGHTPQGADVWSDDDETDSEYERAYVDGYEQGVADTEASIEEDLGMAYDEGYQEGYEDGPKEVSIKYKSPEEILNDFIKSARGL